MGGRAQLDRQALPLELSRHQNEILLSTQFTSDEFFLIHHLFLPVL
jgi:hypothetical protein